MRQYLAVEVQWCCIEWWAEAEAHHCESEVEESEHSGARLVFHFHFMFCLLTFSFFFQIDEATSTLDPTSCILVFEALERWCKNKMTIVSLTIFR
ncbi:hypothetical protein L208DRAFT_878813 [Tricholoma matsutake]|nr:hypothetical protein L208DRAFT_878813 [Tricholoma matsutake 945]